MEHSQNVGGTKSQQTDSEGEEPKSLMNPSCSVENLSLELQGIAAIEYLASL